MYRGFMYTYMHMYSYIWVRCDSAQDELATTETNVWTITSGHIVIGLKAELHTVRARGPREVKLQLKFAILD